MVLSSHLKQSLGCCPTGTPAIRYVDENIRMLATEVDKARETTGWKQQLGTDIALNPGGRNQQDSGWSDIDCFSVFFEDSLQEWHFVKQRIVLLLLSAGALYLSFPIMCACSPAWLALISSCLLLVSCDSSPCLAISVETLS